MYKALMDIGEFKKGDEVPQDKASLWLSMYKVPPVGIDGEDAPNPPEDKGEESNPEDKREDATNPMIDDYLGRNANVVIKNLEEDKHELKDLEEMKMFEESHKNRTSVMEAIEAELKAKEEE